MFKHRITFAAVVGLVFALAPAAQAGLLWSDIGGITAPAGLSQGATFHFIFVTSTNTQATSTDIADYNAFVNGVADGSTIDGVKDVTWYAVGSTTSDSANANAVAAGPVYRLDGVLMSSDLYGTGATGGTPCVNESGGGRSDHVWTGSVDDGGPSIGFELGDADWVTVGCTDWADFGWIFSYEDGDPPEAYRGMYALSQLLTVVPEPATLALLGLGGLGLIWRRKHR